MRSIFFRLLLSFSLTILLAGLISGLIMFSFSRRSVDSFRRDFQHQMQNSIARSMALAGQAAYMMRQHRGDRAFVEYVQEIRNATRTRLYLGVAGAILPEKPALDPDIARLVDTADAKPIIQDDGRQLVVVQRLETPEGQAFTVIGIHQLGPPPGMDRMPPPPRGGEQNFPPPRREGFFSPFGRAQELSFLVFLPIAGVICYLLARSFSAPLSRLRTISRQIAAGDLSARVGTSLGKPGNEIGDLARDFDHMAERMEGLVNGQKRLLLDISHELRSPLARLNLALELAKKRFQAEEDGNFARISRESERLNNLIGQLLALTRSEAKSVDAQSPQVPLADLVLEIAEDVDFETRNQGKGVRVGDLEPVSVAGSRELLRQAIENIVRNGAYYTRPGTRVEVSLVVGAADCGGPAAVIRVRDYGPGVPEEKLPNLIEPFFRVAEARDRNSGGAGLGLAIAHQAVEQHGGSLSFANAPNRNGLLVEIRLPLQRTLPTEQPA
jgi:two-component system sensor histidine kinase CpxA